jgi:CPA1 family monovalent cation:H+ antiporter
VAAVAVVARWFVPDMPWAAAIALGAIVAPPDAAAATAVLRQLRPPHRLLVILEGESLFNDATALLIYRLAVAAAVGGMVVGWNVVPTLLLVTVGSVVLGLALSRVMLFLSGRVNDVATSVVVQFIGTFAVWIIAERLHLSGILTMVVFAMTVARTAPDRIPARLRIPSYAVWEVAVFVLNVLAFILVGLQLKPILARLERAEVIVYLGTAAAVCAAVILARIVWVMGAEVFGWWLRRCGSARSAVVVAWCGMRGTVTLAAALALPAAGANGPFPYRDLVLFTAFCVVVGTLVVQGLTLGPLMRRLDLQHDDSVDREIALARRETAQAAVDVLDGVEGDLAHVLRRRYQRRLARGNGEPSGDGAANPGHLLRRAVEAERQRLSALRADGTIGDDAFHRVEEELDWAELNADTIRSQG